MSLGDFVWYLLFLLDTYEMDDRIFHFSFLRLVDGNCKKSDGKGAYMAMQEVVFRQKANFLLP